MLKKLFSVSHGERKGAKEEWVGGLTQRHRCYRDSNYILSGLCSSMDGRGCCSGLLVVDVIPACVILLK